MTFEWYHWAVLGVVLVLTELMIPTLVLVWFGLGALIVAGLLSLSPETGFITQLLLWAASSVAFVLLWFKVFKRFQHKTAAGRSSAEIVGEVGLLVSDIEPFGRAKVRFQTPLVGSDIWECISDEKIKAGSRVRVISVDGNILKIAQEKPQ